MKRSTFFDRGMKRLVIELELEHLVVYLVHLALGGKTRHQQLANLYESGQNDIETLRCCR